MPGIVLVELRCAVSWLHPVSHALNLFLAYVQILVDPSKAGGAVDGLDPFGCAAEFVQAAGGFLIGEKVVRFQPRLLPLRVSRTLAICGAGGTG